MKPFDQELYDRDDGAKHFVIDWLKIHGITARVNPDDFGIDLLGQGQLGDYEIEIEVKQGWSGEYFPYPTLHYASRKMKFVKPNVNLRFITLNKEWTYAAVVKGEDLIAAKIVQKDTIYTKGEYFIEVPIADVKIYRTHMAL